MQEREARWTARDFGSLRVVRDLASPKGWPVILMLKLMAQSEIFTRPASSIKGAVGEEKIG
jgi:hypothetical protein